MANTCRADLGLKLPMIVDGIKNTTEASYSAWPDRLYLVDTQGTIAYRGDRGPWGFKPDKLEAAIKATLSSLAVAKKKYSEAELEAIRERLRARRKESLDKENK